MTTSNVEEVRQRLLRRRQVILEASLRAAAGIDQLRSAERDPESEEASQSEQAQYDLTRLGEVEQQEIAQIDATVQRLDAGAYGACRDCGEAIDLGRLAALPYALDCAECASRREEAVALERERAGKPRVMTPE